MSKELYEKAVELHDMAAAEGAECTELCSLFHKSFDEHLHAARSKDYALTRARALKFLIHRN